MKPAAAARTRSAGRATVTIIGALAVYEVVARAGIFPAALLPTIPTVAKTLIAMLADGTMEKHALSTLLRVLFGRRPHPFHSLTIILCDTQAILVHYRQPVLGFGIPLLGIGAQQLHGARKFFGFKCRHGTGKIHHFVVFRHSVLRHCLSFKPVSIS